MRTETLIPIAAAGFLVYWWATHKTDISGSSGGGGGDSTPAPGSMSIDQVVATFPEPPPYPHTNDWQVKINYAAHQATRDLALQLRVPFGDIRFEGAEDAGAAAWPDYGLGCPTPAGTTFVPIPSRVGGWKLFLSHAGRRYEYRVDYGGTAPLPCYRR